MLDEVDLPKTIVVSSDCYRTCIEFLLYDLWTEPVLRWFGDGILNNVREIAEPVDNDVLEELRVSLALPQTRRRYYVHDQWSRNFDRRVAAWILSLRLRADAVRWLRIDPRRSISWVSNLPRSVDRRDWKSREICAALVETYEYCLWIDQGGDESLGRWIARHHEMRAAGR